MRTDVSALFCWLRYQSTSLAEYITVSTSREVLRSRPAAHGRRMSGRQTRGVEALRGQPGVARQHGVEHPIEPASDIPVEPPLAARRTLVHRDLEHDGDPAATFAELAGLTRLPVALIAAFAAHHGSYGRSPQARSVTCRGAQPFELGGLIPSGGGGDSAQRPPGCVVVITSSEIRAESGYGELQAVTTPARKRPVTRTYGNYTHATAHHQPRCPPPTRHTQVRPRGQSARRPLYAFCTNQALGRRRGP